jgi:hypothetical protein
MALVEKIITLMCLIVKVWEEGGQIAGSSLYVFKINRELRPGHIKTIGAIRDIHRDRYLPVRDVWHDADAGALALVRLQQERVESRKEWFPNLSMYLC